MSESAGTEIQHKKKKTVSMPLSPESVPPAQQAQQAPLYRLYNDTDRYAAVYLQEWNKPKGAFILPPGAVSGNYESGHEIYVNLVDPQPQGDWFLDWGKDLTVYYDMAMYPSAGLNKISKFPYSAAERVARPTA